MNVNRKTVTRLLRIYWIILLPSNQHEATTPAHVAIVADPQIVDHYSYDQTGIILRLTEFFTDIYLRKSYRFLQTLKQPQKIIFLGDLMDGGREWTDKQWVREFHRYQSIFANRNPEKTQIYNMAGNHDIGIGNTVVDHALDRFHKYVGPTNQILDIADHQVILLDTLTLENDDPNKSRASRQLLDHIAKKSMPDNKQQPRVLFTHVPLWRPPQTYCGKERQSKHGYLLNRRGYQFRDQLFQNTTQHILQTVQPTVIFSGDDHDSCTVEHEVPGYANHSNSNSNKATEYTIGAFGWASGVPIASYALLTLYPRTETMEPTLMVQRCFLPYQLGIYKVYLASLAASMMAIAVFCYRGSHTWRQPGLREQRREDQAVCLENGQNTAAGLWSFSRRAFVRYFARIFFDVLVAGVPTYVLCLLFFYVF
ncbi:hypothetical protein LPJ57_001303 [Coemansia sp. RSA 486]|nr:hypothetical protein LPJ57_001303 [Coemansia sp. RSA 486]KAJ2598134.1 hypothetical protein GGF39_002771 [Coemansia sp. RSA 1721]KAJ2636692.1 hypothetical protein GGF40_002850 [Coemansia sp. RSA 1286]